MAISVYQYPKCSLQEKSKLEREIWEKAGLESSVLSIDNVLSPTSFGRPVAHANFGLKLAVLRAKEPEEEKKKIRDALESLGFTISQEEYPDKSMREAIEKSNFSGDKLVKFPEGEGDTQEELIRGVYLNEIRKREGMICHPVQNLIKLLPYNNDSIISCQFVAYDPARINLFGFSGYAISSIEKSRKFEAFELPNNSGIDAELLEDKLQKMSIGPEIAVGISSRVVMDNGSIMHVPIIDFINPPRPSYESLYSDEFIDLVRKFGLSGVLLESGNSYHFYGNKLQTPEEREQFIAKISEEELVGKFWPKLQLEQGYSLLRITPCILKPHFPTFEENIK